MAIGKAIRMNRLLNKNKMLCIPLDHGITNGPIRGIEDVHKIIYDCENSGLTCVIVNNVRSFRTPKNLDIESSERLLNSTFNVSIVPGSSHTIKSGVRIN